MRKINSIEFDPHKHVHGKRSGPLVIRILLRTVGVHLMTVLGNRQCAMDIFLF